VAASSASALDFASMGYTYDTLGGPAVAAARERLGLQQPPNQRGLQPPEIAKAPQTLGADITPKTVVPSAETAYTIAAKDLLPSLFRPRTFRAIKIPTVQRLAVGDGRILVRMSVIPPPKQTSLICKVFVNCPYLVPSTSSTDPHYAGSYSFFGQHGRSHDPAKFYIDLTKPLRTLSEEGRLDPEQVRVQLMPIAAAPGTAADTTFAVEKVELLSA
jgi:tyrosinase